MAFAACCWVGRLPFGRSPSSLNRDGPPFWWSPQALYSVILNLDLSRGRVCCWCWLSTCACPGMALLARNHPLVGAAGGGQSDKRAISGFGLASLSSSQGGVATFVEPGSGPPLTVSLSLPLAGQGPGQYRDDQSGWSRRPLVCMVSNCRRTRSEANVYHTLMVHSTAGDSVRRSSSSWALAGPSDGSCPWEQRDNHSRTGDPVLVMREGL